MIHETAVVERGAEIGEGVTIGPMAYVQAGATIGSGCVIGPHASVLAHTTLGADCRVHAGAVLGDVPQDKAFQPCESSARIGARCTIREGVTIHRGTKPGTATEIGEDGYLMAFSHFAHNVKLGKGVTVANGALLAGYVEVGDGSFISGNVLLHQFVRIGRLAMLGGGCAIGKDVPPFCLVGALTRNGVAGLNVVGLRRSGLAPEAREQIRQAFKILYTSGLNVSQATARMKETFPSGPALEFCAFVESAHRGICPLGGGEEV